MGSDGLCKPFEIGAYAQNTPKSNVAIPVIFETLAWTLSNVVLMGCTGPPDWRGIGRRCTKSFDDKCIRNNTEGIS